ncbi:MAG TPA: site-specific DNA-methyltransferase [Thermoanaerobaculia bacterium]|nr:site-specific DNA-methyltransferase [Thermoanaerobaculia bacterium]
MSPEARIIHGHVLDVLRAMPAESVHSFVTSPPYWGLRDYKIPPQIWGGDPGCHHDWAIETVTGEYRTGRGLAQLGEKYRPGGKCGGLKQGSVPTLQAERGQCLLCGAWLGSLGLEPTVAEYVAHLVEVFEEARRVLREDGTLWLNLGDSYYSKPNGSIGRSGLEGSLAPHAESRRAHSLRKRGGDPTLKHKDLVGVPWRVAFALQEAGWWLRSDCIWSKPNPMPESVTDRPTKAHEYVFLLSKSARYYYDAAAVREPVSQAVLDRPYKQIFNSERMDMPGASPGRRGCVRKADALQGAHGTTGQDGNGMRMPEKWSNPEGRNLRTVWTIATHAYPEAHFATFPPDLAETCIKAGTSERGACSACGAPWTRVEAREFEPQSDVSAEKGRRAQGDQKPMAPENGWGDSPRGTTRVMTRGWEPSCLCLRERIEAVGIQWPLTAPQATALAPQFDDLAPVPCTVLDPFGGAGTVAMVALRLGRSAISIELSPDYVTMQERRIREDAPLLNRPTIESAPASAGKENP